MGFLKDLGDFFKPEDNDDCNSASPRAFTQSSYYQAPTGFNTDNLFSKRNNSGLINHSPICPEPLCPVADISKIHKTEKAFDFLSSNRHQTEDFLPNRDDLGINFSQNPICTNPFKPAEIIREPRSILGTNNDIGGNIRGVPNGPLGGGPIDFFALRDVKKPFSF